MKAEYISGKEVLEHFKRRLEEGIRRAQVFIDVISTDYFEVRALKYSTVRQLVKLGAEFYVLDDWQKFFFPIKPTFLRFLPVVKRLSRLQQGDRQLPVRVGNSLYIPLPLRPKGLKGVLSVYVGEVDERPYSTPFDNAAGLDYVAMDVNSPEFREWFDNTVNHISCYQSLYLSYGADFPPKPHDCKAVVFASESARNPFGDSAEWEPFWPRSRYFTGFPCSYVVPTDEEIKRRQEEREERLRKARERTDRLMSVVKNIEAKHTPFIVSDRITVYAVQPEDVAGFLDDEVLKRVKSVAENIYCMVGYFYGYFNRVNRDFSLPLKYLKALRVMGRRYLDIYETTLPIKPRLLIVVYNEALSSEILYVAVGFTPRRHQEINAPTAKVIRTPKRIIFLPPPESG